MWKKHKLVMLPNQKAKQNWNREEVIELLEKFNDRYGYLGLVGDFRKVDLPKFEKFIEENL